MSTVTQFVERRTPTPRTVVLVVLVVLLEALFAVGYVGLTGAGITRPTMAVAVPAVWLNLSALVFLLVRPAKTDGGRWAAALVAVGYLLLLAVLGGLLTAGDGSAAGLRIHAVGFPGWVPLVIYDAAAATVVVVPFKLVGYLALSYLVYVTAVDAAGTVLGGAIGLFSCVSCTFPLLAGLVSSLTGGGAAAAAVYSNGYLLSTLVFVITVGLLAWRPAAGGLDRVRGWWPR